MTVSSFEQLRMFLLLAAAGAVCGAVGCFFKALRQRMGGVGFAAVTDLAFWAFSAAALIWTAMRFCGGEMRGFQLIAAACGGAMYVLCLGEVTLKLSLWGIKVTGIVLSPFAFLLRGLRLYLRRLWDGFVHRKEKLGKMFCRIGAVTKKRKKIQKNYKKLL